MGRHMDARVFCSKKSPLILRRTGEGGVEPNSWQRMREMVPQRRQAGRQATRGVEPTVHTFSHFYLQVDLCWYVEFYLPHRA